MVAKEITRAVGQLRAVTPKPTDGCPWAGGLDAAHLYRGNTATLGTEKRGARRSRLDFQDGAFIVLRAASDALLANASFFAVLAEHDRAFDARDAARTHVEIPPLACFLLARLLAHLGAHGRRRLGRPFGGVGGWRSSRRSGGHR